MQAGFLFDPNKCTGCQACQIACTIENNLEPPHSWRNVITHNNENIQGIPTYHLSLACNHCLHPVCMEQCPARAYSKNSDTGAVLIDAEKCIGCQFCSWVCPYDAPKFDHTSGVMTKCTFCHHRLEEGMKPACVSICPTGALDFGEHHPQSPPAKIAGFPPSNISPAIQIESIEPDHEVPQQISLPYPPEMMGKYLADMPSGPPKISLKKEWPLIIFTVLMALLGALSSAVLFGSMGVNPYVFIAAGTAGMFLSTIHLGQKKRAYRAIFNLRSSWLSREILFSSLFMASAAGFLLFPGLRFMGWAALLLSISTVFSADNLYLVIANSRKDIFHSAQVTLTLALFMAMFNFSLPGFIFTAAIKLFLYLRRKFRYRDDALLPAIAISLLRIIPLLITPVVWMSGDLHEFSGIIFITVIAGEIIDRVEFYRELQIVTPEMHMREGFLDNVKKQVPTGIQNPQRTDPV